MEEKKAMVEVKVQCLECGFRCWIPEEKENIKPHISKYGVLNPTTQMFKACDNCGALHWHRVERTVERGEDK